MATPRVDASNIMNMKQLSPLQYGAIFFILNVDLALLSSMSLAVDHPKMHLRMHLKMPLEVCHLLDQRLDSYSRSQH